MKQSAQLDLLQGYPLKDEPSFRSERKLLMLPFFTLGKKPIHEARESRWHESGRDYYIRNSPGEDGLPTMWDFDKLAYIETVIVKAMNRNEPVSPRVRFHVHDCLSAIGQGTSGKDYDAFIASMRRLKGSTVFTNVESADAIEDGGFGWLQSFKVMRRKTASGKEVMTSCEVVLCEWLFNAITKEGGVLSLDPAYFQLDKGLDRKLYQIIRAHLGRQTSWQIGLDRLMVKTGFNGPLRRFLFEVKEIQARQPFDEWIIMLTHDSRQFSSTIPNPATITSRKPVTLWAVRRGLRIV